MNLTAGQLPGPRRRISPVATPTTVSPPIRGFARVGPDAGLDAADGETEIQAAECQDCPEATHGFGRLAVAAGGDGLAADPPVVQARFEGTAGESVVQRLIYLKPSKDLLVHKGYYERSIPKDGKNYPLIKKLPNQKQRNASVEDLYTENDTKAEFLALVKSGLMLDDAVRTIDTPAVTDNKVAGLNAQMWGYRRRRQESAPQASAEAVPLGR